MKKQVFLLMMTVAIVFSCNDDNLPFDETGTITFTIPVSENMAEPAALVVSVEDEEGTTILQDKLLSVTRKDQNYVTEGILLEKGNYHITKFIVSSNQTATYATPRAGSQKATLIDEPLPLAFGINGNQPSVSPTLVGIATHDAPESFGYSDFGFDDVENPSEEWMNVRVKFELTVGQIYYPDIDLEFVVTAYDESNAEQWNQSFSYIGPQSNDLRIKSGFHHYKFEARKWGTSTKQTFIGAELWNERVREGSVPLTRVFTKTINPKRVSGYVRSGLQNVNGEKKMIPESKTEFEFNTDGTLKAIQYFNARPSGEFVVNKRSEFTYTSNLISKIKTFENGTNATLAEDFYSYDALGKLTKIQHKESGITTDVNLTYIATDRVIQATYSLSNGNGFSYEFFNQSGNAKTDRTTRGTQLCSEGAFTYDKNINPLKHLGYVDYLFRNYSYSNRLTEDISYTGCAFPTLIPESYHYTYDEEGYPILATTNYKTSVYKTQVEYFYQ